MKFMRFITLYILACCYSLQSKLFNLIVSMFMTYIVKQQQIPKFMFSFITFMLEDEHRLSLGMLMHVKCIHELCHLLLLIFPLICMFLDVIYMFYNVLWGFSNNPLSLVYNFAEQETPISGIFYVFRTLRNSNRTGIFLV